MVSLMQMTLLSTIPYASPAAYCNMRTLAIDSTHMAAGVGKHYHKPVEFRKDE